MPKGGRRARSGPQVPTEMKLIHGTFRADRDGDKVVLAPKFPDAPAHLRASERALWEELRPRVSWATDSDGIALNGLVSIMAQLLTNQARQQATDPTDLARLETLEAREVTLWDKLRHYIGILGLSPVDRARVQRPGATAAVANPLDKFLKVGRP